MTTPAVDQLRELLRLYVLGEDDAASLMWQLVPPEYWEEIAAEAVARIAATLRAVDRQRALQYIADWPTRENGIQ